MRTYNEYKRILIEWEACGNQHEVARRTGIPRTTVQRYINRYQTVANFESEFEFVPKYSVLEELKNQSPVLREIHFHYAYVLGIYLGDGEINLGQRSYRLVVTLDQKYPNIIQRCVTSIQTLVPANSVSYYNCPRGNCVRVSCYYKYWPQVFPQHGKGVKHERDIILEDWQQTIVNAFPLEFFRGLYHSDGSRSQNIVNDKDYPRYMFANFSDDIMKLYTDTVEKLGLRWTQTNARNVAISRRKDVAWLDEHVGPKS